ncbi:hypothetical protein SAMN06264364_101445 [Quadrisphaera granulorum]|uniref:Uncharacterized protein n=1 Tax=Quadrisphaera granulorum TaxID=317664 RepID=A0A316B1N5_9ACTN|nr:hypothetical protein BXY45_101445 [Quadrisphaera granulorum]SZE95101.1 hypothetical protein SAMN06264364_101445 [Quadrisphaera granulorum]
MTPRIMGRLLLAAAPFGLAVAIVERLALGAPEMAAATWVLVGASVLAVLWGWFCLELQRDCEAILAAMPSAASAPQSEVADRP